MRGLGCRLRHRAAPLSLWVGPRRVAAPPRLRLGPAGVSRSVSWGWGRSNPVPFSLCFRWLGRRSRVWGGPNRAAIGVELRRRSPAAARRAQLPTDAALLRSRAFAGRSSSPALGIRLVVRFFSDLLPMLPLLIHVPLVRVPVFDGAGSYRLPGCALLFG